MKKSKIITAAVVLLVLAAFSVAYSYGGGRSHGRGPYNGDCLMADLSYLKLTADQMAKINALREAHLKEIKPLRDKDFSKRGEIRLLWMQEKPDEAKIRAAQKELGALRNEIDDKRTTFRLEMLKVLTSEQQSKLRSRYVRCGGCARGAGQGMEKGMRGDCR